MCSARILGSSRGRGIGVSLNLGGLHGKGVGCHLPSCARPALSPPWGGGRLTVAFIARTGRVSMSRIVYRLLMCLVSFSLIADR